MIFRLVPLWAVFLLPLAFWAPLEDAFKLPQSILAVAMFLFLAVVAVFNPGRFRNILSVPVMALCLGYILAAVLGRGARGTDVAVFLALSISAMLLAGRAGLGGKMVSAMIIAGTVSSLYSILQFAGLDMIPSPGGGQGLRPFSTMGNPDFMAAYLVAVLPIAAVQWSMNRRLIGILPVVSMSMAVLLTQSRGAWLGIAAAIALVPFLLSFTGNRIQITRGMGIMAAALLAVVAGFFYFHGQARERLSRTFSTGHFDAAGRIFMWKAAMGMIGERPLAGTGPGGFGKAYPEWHARGLARQPDFPWFYTENAHNDYLQIPAEVGIPVFGLFIWVWVVFVRMAIRLARSGDRIALGMLAGFAAIQVDAVFNFPWYIVPTQAWFWISFSVMAGRRPGGGGRDVVRATGGIAPGIRAGLAVVPALAACFFMLRDIQANAWLKLSGDFLFANRNPEARACAEMALKRWGIWEGKARGANNASLASYSMDDYPAAEKYSLISLSLSPKMPASLSQLALVRARAGKLAEAEKDCQEALQLNPHQAEAWHVLGNLAYMRRDLAGALSAWEKAFAENPSIPGLRQNLEVLRRGSSGKRGLL